MRIFIRTVAALTVLAVLLVSLVSCHGAKETVSFEVPDGFDMSKTYELTFWAKNDTNQTQVDIYHKAISDFEKLYPNIKVTLKPYTDYGRIYQDVITNIATSTTPNVCITYPDHIATYMTGENVVVPLDSLMTDEKYGFGGSEVKFDSPSKDEIVPKFLEEGVIGGYQYALPFMRSTEVCYVNKTFVEKLGFTLPEKLTWDFVWKVSEAAAEKNADGTFKVNGQNVMLPFIYKSTDNMMIQLLKQKGAEYSSASGDVKIFNDTTRELLLDIANHTKSGAFSTFKISGYPANFLNAGQCIFAIDSTAGATWMGSDAPLVDIDEDKIVKFETVVMPLPQYDNEDPVMISQGPSLCIFNKEDSGEVLASWLFAQYLLTNDVQISYAQTEGYVPVTLKAQNDDEYKDYLSREGEDNGMYYGIKLRATKLLIENTDNTFVTPVFNGSAALRDAAGQMIEEVTKAVRRKKTVDGAFIDALYEKVTSLHRLDSIETQQTGGDLGEYPTTAKVLVFSLVGVWAVMGGYVVWNIARKRRNAKK